MTNASLQVHHLRIHATAKKPIEFQESVGSSLRGAFLEAMWSRFCMNRKAQACASCPLVRACPVGKLVAPVGGESLWLRDIPRPFTLRPAASRAESVQEQEPFSFGLTLFGSHLELFPFIVLALSAMGTRGIGNRVPSNGWQRGSFAVDSIRAVNVLTGTEELVQTAENARCTFPTVSTTWRDAEQCAASLRPDQVTIRLLSPLRLKSKGKFLQRPEFRPLVERLLERHDCLARSYAGVPFEREERLRLLTLADAVAVTHDETRWLEVRSYSSRQHRAMPVDGLVGSVTYSGELLQLLPLLLWGTVIQVGKSVTKGGGIYELCGGTAM